MSINEYKRLKAKAETDKVPERAQAYATLALAEAIRLFARKSRG